MTAMFALTTFVSRVEFAVVATLAVGIGLLVTRLVPVLGVAAGIALMASRLGHRPELAWLALALFVAAVVATRAGRSDGDHPEADPPEADRPELRHSAARE